MQEFVGRARDGGTVADQSVVGAVGKVTRVVRGGRMPGEIRIVDAGLPILLMAYCDRPLEVGTRVRITHSRGSSQVDVDLWP